MSVYLIDYENVHYAGLSGIDKLTPTDEVILFYGNSASTIPMELHIGIAGSGAKVQYIRIERMAKNYLDFQLASMAGYLVGTTRQEEFIIISNDTGFEAVLDLWNGQTFAGRRLHFSRRDQIAEGEDVKKGKGKKAKNAKGKKPSKDKEKTEAKERKQAKGKSKKVSKEAQQEGASGGSDPAQQKEMQPLTETSAPKQGAARESESVYKADAAQRVETAPKPESAQREEPTADRTSAGRHPQRGRLDKIAESEKKKIRLAVKELGLKPTDYTKVYKVYQVAEDKQAYNNGLVKALKQEKGNQVYKATVGILY